MDTLLALLLTYATIGTTAGLVFGVFAFASLQNERAILLSSEVDQLRKDTDNPAWLPQSLGGAVAVMVTIGALLWPLLIPMVIREWKQQQR